jgi:hypothetical protein
MLTALLACTDYEFSKGTDAFEGPRATDTGVVDAPDTDDSGGADTAPPPDTAPPEDPPPDTGPPAEDPCYEPEDGYALNPAARLVVYDASQAITVTFSYSDTSYSDVLWVESPGYSQLFEAWATSAGTSYTLGPYPVGTEVIFGLRVENTGDHWQSGPTSRNDDGVVHGAATYLGACRWAFGFEDLRGGGDLDYNDVMFEVAGPFRQEE